MTRSTLIGLICFFTLVACPEYNINELGDSVDEGEPDLLVSEVNYGNAYVDCALAGWATVTNVGSADAVVVGIETTAENYLPVEMALPFTLAPGESRPIEVWWTPLAGGADSATLQVEESTLSTFDGALSGVALNASESFDVVEPAAESIYLHSSSYLSSYDQSSGTLTSIGSLGVSLLDIAIDEWGQLWGVGSSTLYQVDSATGAASSYMSLAGGGNGLAVLADGTLIISSGHTISQVDWSTGALTTLATISWGSSSGDIVQWDGSLYWTVTGVSEGDSLVKYDMSTGTLTNLGSTGVSGLYGIAAPDGVLLAFSISGRVYELDISSGLVIRSRVASGAWYGAAHNPSYARESSYSFHLVGQPIDEVRIDVEVNGVASTDWSYDAGHNTIVFEDGMLLSAGDVVDVLYALEGECE